VTKIIPTFSVDTEDNYKKRLTLYDNLNIDTIRFNLTRYTFDEYQVELDKIRAIQKEISKKKMKIIFDVPYPGTKARIKFDGQEANVDVRNGEIIKITKDISLMDVENRILFVENIDDLEQSTTGQVIEIDDGRLNLSFIEKKDDLLVFKTMGSGSLKYMKSINRKEHIFFREKRMGYMNNLINFVENNEPWGVCFSFVETKEDMIKLQECFSENETKLIPKIETPTAINNLEEILDYCDMAMLGRGDLALTGGGNMMGYYQEKFISTCKAKGKNIIIATDIMNSLAEFTLSFPLRSDLIDLDNLVKNKVDYIVTSGEMGKGTGLKKTKDLLNGILDTRLKMVNINLKGANTK